MIAQNEAQKKRNQLTEEGYCLIDGILDEPILSDLKLATARIIEEEDEYTKSNKNFGGLIIDCPFRDPSFARLLAWQPTLDLLSVMGFDDVRWIGNLFLINKPPFSPRLYWHQDWLWWDEPVSSEPRPMQVFLSYYLEETTIENGCFRVIPRSHLRRNVLHDKIPIAHDTKIGNLPPAHPVFEDVPDAVNVPTKEGSIVMGDARLLHSANANNTPKHRPLLLGWFLFNYALYPPSIKEAYAKSYKSKISQWWEGNIGDPLKLLAVDDPTGCTATEINRTPGIYLKKS